LEAGTGPSLPEAGLRFFFTKQKKSIYFFDLSSSIKEN
jgi:hypothetical protein